MRKEGSSTEVSPSHTVLERGLHAPPSSCCTPKHSARSPSAIGCGTWPGGCRCQGRRAKKLSPGVHHKLHVVYLRHAGGSSKKDASAAWRGRRPSPAQEVPIALMHTQRDTDRIAGEDSRDEGRNGSPSPMPSTCISSSSRPDRWQAGGRTGRGRHRGGEEDGMATWRGKFGESGPEVGGQG